MDHRRPVPSFDSSRFNDDNVRTVYVSPIHTDVLFLVARGCTREQDGIDFHEINGHPLYTK